MEVQARQTQAEVGSSGVIDTSMNMADMGTKHLTATTRRTLLALMPLCCGERLGTVTIWDSSRSEDGMTSSETTTACTTMDNTTVDSSTAVHCWQIFLHVNQAMVIVAVFPVCVHKVKITRRCREVGDFNNEGDTHFGRRTSRSLGANVREASKKVVPAEHTPRVSRSLVCRRAGRRDVADSTLNLTMTHVHLRSVMRTELVDVETTL